MELKEKAKLLKKKFVDEGSFTVADASEALKEKKSTLYWSLWKLVDEGYIRRIRRGVYSFTNGAKIRPVLSSLGKEVFQVLRESGYSFFISGLDVLSVFMEHLPESYPVLVFVDKNSVREVNELLSEKGFDSIIYSEIKSYARVRQLSSVSEVVLLNGTNEFKYSEKGVASFEKSFVDLYFEVSRKGYPLSVQELIRIYLNMKRRIYLDKKRLIKIASRRSIHSDIRYLVNHENISEAAHEFVENLKRLEKSEL